MTTALNVLTRPKRSIHSRKIVITEELAKLIGGKEYNSESDEEFIPDKKKIKNNNENENENEIDSDSDQSKSSNSVDDDDIDESSCSTIVNSENENENECEINNSEKSKKIISGDEEQKNGNKESKCLKNVKKNVTNNKNLKSIKNNDDNNEKNETKSKSKKNTKQKREYNKRKKLHQLKADKIKNEKKIILDKLSSRINKSSTGNNGKVVYNGPVVRLDNTFINNKSYPMYIVANSRNTNDLIENVNNNDNTKIDIKIPKEKIPTIADPSGIWLCKLCSNRPNHKNLGDLYGPYFCDKDTKNEIWFHEACIVWTPNVYIKDNKLFGLSDAIDLASNNDCNACKKTGATLNCSNNFCNSNYHYPCAMTTNCKFNNDSFTILCNKHV